MSSMEIDRRGFLRTAGAGLAATQFGLATSGALLPSSAVGAEPTQRADYRGPNVFIIRFGGGARRRETIDAVNTYSPFLCHELTQRGTLLKDMFISHDARETSHGQGTLNILTGLYDDYKDIGQKFLGQRFEAKVPTVFEYLRKAYAVPDHQTLIINGEDRTDEEFYTFSNHHLFGVNYRSNVLSLYRFKTFLLRRQIEANTFHGAELDEKQKELTQMEALDYRREGDLGQSAEIEKFWDRWRSYYGDSGFKNPRGDRLLTELSLWSLQYLRPKLMMVNYNDCDYVHWGNMSHYTQGVAIMDRGLREIINAVDADEEYRDNTVFVIVPDCGRDSNPFMSVPCQHHFNSRSSREIFALFMGPGIDRGRVVDRRVEQNMVAATVAQLMGCRAEFAQGAPIAEVFA